MRGVLALVVLLMGFAQSARALPRPLADAQEELDAASINSYSHVDVAAAARRHTSSSVRRAALVVLSTTAPTSARTGAVLMEALSDSDAEVRATAVWAHGVLGQRSARAVQVGRTLLADPQNRKAYRASVRLLAAEGLARMRVPDGRHALDQMLTDESPLVRILGYAAFRDLGPLGEIDAFEAVSSCLAKEPATLVRTVCVQLCSSIRGGRRDLIRAALMREPDKAIRMTGLRALDEKP